MELDIGSFFSSFWSSFSQSSFFFYLKVIAAFAIVVLLVADILLLSKRMRTDLRVALYGSGTPRLKKSKYFSDWENIKRRLDEGNTASGKMALVEADRMLDEILGKLGYAGKDAEEKIQNIKPGQLVGIEDIKETQILCDRIIENPAYKASLEEIKAALGVYERVFRGLEIIE